MPKNSRSPSFRYCHANKSKITLLNGEVTIIFGIQEDPSDLNRLFEEVGVVMTHSAAKLLADALHQALERIEKELASSAPAVPADSTEQEPLSYSELEKVISLAIDAQLKSGDDDS